MLGEPVLDDLFFVEVCRRRIARLFFRQEKFPQSLARRVTPAETMNVAAVPVDVAAALLGS
jgi:hypothetical protein